MARHTSPEYPLDNVLLAAKVEDGIPAHDVAAFGRAVGFSGDEMARFIQVPPRTFARRLAQRARLKLAEGDRAVRIMRLYHQAKRIFGTQQKTHAWLSRPLRILGGRTPLDFARTEAGAREVEAVLERFASGVYS